MKSLINILNDSKYICFVIPKFFSEIECKQLLNTQIKNSFQKAISNYPTYYRNNDRLVIDNKELSKQIFAKLKDYLPENIKDINNQLWNPKELNRKIRYCKYSANQYFNRHLDGIHYVSENQQSKLTFMVYLNGSEDFQGGRTLFYKSKDDEEVWAEYYPQKGDLIIFDHNIWHEGELLTSGEKYILRSDIIFEKQTINFKEKNNSNFEEGHLGYIWKLLKFKENIILSSGRDKLIKVWDKKGICIQKLEKHNNSITSLAKINYNTFVSGSRDKTVSIWKLKNNSFELKANYKIHNATVLSVCKITQNTFSTSGADNLIHISNIKGEKLNTLNSHQNWVWNLIKINKNIIASCSEDKTIKIWDLENSQCIRTINDQFSVYCLVKKNNLLVSGNYNGEIKIFDINKDYKLLKSFKAHNGIIKSMVFFNDYLISGGEDNLIKIWNLKSLKCIKEYQHDNFVQSIIKINENQILSASYDGKIKLSNITYTVH